MIVAHIMGMPVEESALALAPAGAAIVSCAAVIARSKLAAIAGWLRASLLGRQAKAHRGSRAALAPDEPRQRRRARDHA